MNQRVLLVLLFCVATTGAEIVIPGVQGSPSAQEPTANENSAKLLWKNSEVIPGQLMDATGTQLSWKSELFDEPLRLRWEAIRRFEQSGPSAAAPESFSVMLRDGSHLVGDLVGFDSEVVKIRSVRHGTVDLRRPDVLRLRRLRGEKIIAAGPSGPVGWQIAEVKDGNGQAQTSPVPRLVSGLGGALVMPYWNTKADLAIETPDRFEFEVSLRFTKTPGFSLRFDGDTKRGIRVETWGNELVVVQGDEFQSVRNIDENERELLIRIRWDRAAKKGTIFNAAGQAQAEWKFIGDFGKPAGWTLENRSFDLTLTQLWVRAYGEGSMSDVQSAKTGIVFTGGKRIDGGINSAAGDQLSIVPNSGGEQTNHALKDIAEIIFSTDQPKLPEGGVIMTFADGTVCHGQIVSIRDGKGSLRTEIAEAPLSLSMVGLRRISLNENPAKKVDQTANPADPPGDELFIGSTKFSGSYAPSPNGRLRWIPNGGIAAAAPNNRSGVKVIRSLPDAALAAAPAQFYTKFGDVIPGVFRGFAGTDVAMESEVVEVKKLPAISVNAVQFGDVRQGMVRGFDAPGWRVLKGGEESVRKDGGTLEMEEGGSYGHSSVLQSGEFQFALNPSDCGAFRLRFFTGGEDNGGTVSCVFSPNGSIIYVGIEVRDGEVNGFSTASVDGSKPATVRVEVTNTAVDIYVDEKLVRRGPRDVKRRAGMGLVIEPIEQFDASGVTVKLTDFSTISTPGRTWLPTINLEAKRQALTVPRFRKERPPKHALVATNGDLLRGDIEAVTTTHIGFLAGLEKLRIPRSRVHAAIWLRAPGQGGVAMEDPSPVLELLEQQFQRHMSYGGATLSTLIGVIRREFPAVRFNDPPRERERRRVSMAFGGQTLREVLDQISSLFELNYRIEENGSISFEAGPAKPESFMSEVYMLKSDAFGEAKAGQTWLMEAGVGFPEGANALWNRETQQFRVKHTIEMQGRIRELLKEKFGQDFLELTHWVLLANGARLGMAVEKFEEGAIIGKHPAYGRCRVPMQLVYTIQTTDPGPTEAMRLLANWQLTPAREPVIADSGGEGAPSLGKEAELFKIPLMGGGEFDLHAERGKVVVLDFWATWCSPCIKSIPGLIEAVNGFPADRVKLVGVNQGESVDAVRRFLETRNWKFTVAMDIDQKVGQQYGITGIPHTVIVGPDGKVAWVKTGYSADGATDAAEAIKKLLNAPAGEARQPSDG